MLCFLICLDPIIFPGAKTICNLFFLLKRVVFCATQDAPTGSIILLHGCAHNPTGIDPTPEQWERLADLIEEKAHLPFFDVAYQVSIPCHFQPVPSAVTDA